MDNVFLTLVPAAIGLAIGPAPDIALILVLFSRRRVVVNLVAFMVTLLAMTALVLWLGVRGGGAAGDGSSQSSPVMGCVFHGAVRRCPSRRRVPRPR